MLKLHYKHDQTFKYSLHFSEPSGWASSGAAQSEEERGWQLSVYCQQRSPAHCQQKSPTGYQM